ncbi:MAG TPA: Mrp/NBP35 family ATP-binding protein [Acetobacteraceae bacterium]|nr:Mrp/NBP35 family ATP-binding protein [Acetobacteraceae bacterium]
MSGERTEALRKALRGIVDPASGKDIVSAGLVEGIELKGGLVQVALAVPRERAASMEPVRKAVEATLARQPGITNATAVLTAHRSGTAETPPRGGEPRPGERAGERAGEPRQAATLLPEVRAIVAVASGKGGVGKSTVAVNLAVALARLGRTVGLLDADIYGPSLPRMLGLARRPEMAGEKLVPIEAWGLKAMSIGFLVEEETPMIWRGPMVMGALEQMLGQVAWGKLDFLIVDMPPGTGDAQLTMAQRVKLAGAVIVSTPQDIALIDARRGARMFERTHVPVLGLVENMSVFICPHCGERSEIFGHGGARKEAARLGVPFLGEVPLLLAIRETGDRGTPIAASEPEGAAAQAFSALAANLAEAVERRLATSAPAPRITIS